MPILSSLFSLVWLPGNEQMVLVRKECLCKQRYITKSLDCFNWLPQHYPKKKVLGLQINNYCFHMFYDVTVQQPCLELDWRLREYISPFIQNNKGQEMTRFIFQLLTFYNLNGCQNNWPGEMPENGLSEWKRQRIEKWIFHEYVIIHRTELIKYVLTKYIFLK